MLENSKPPELPESKPRHMCKLLPTNRQDCRFGRAAEGESAQAARARARAQIVEGDLATKQDLKDLEHRLTIKLFALIGAGAATTVTATVAILKLMLSK